MRRVFTSQSTGAGIYVFSDGHCPPHIHAQHRGDGLIARVRFSFAESEVYLVSIAPLRNSPLQRTVNQLLDDIEAELPACRRNWWTTKQTTCLENQLAIILTGTIQIPRGATENAKKIATAVYDPRQDQLQVTFHDGTIANGSARR
jgi:hypothetical protein